MAVSRYAGLKTIFGKLETMPSIDPKTVMSNNDFFIEWASDSRMDIIANEFLGDGRYWWMICMLNGLSLPYGIPLGSILRVPTNPQVILDAINLARTK